MWRPTGTKKLRGPQPPTRTAIPQGSYSSRNFITHISSKLKRNTILGYYNLGRIHSRGETSSISNSKVAYKNALTVAPDLYVVNVLNICEKISYNTLPFCAFITATTRPLDMNRTQVRYTETEQSPSRQTDCRKGSKNSLHGRQTQPSILPPNQNGLGTEAPKPMGILPLKVPVSRMVGADN